MDLAQPRQRAMPKSLIPGAQYNTFLPIDAQEVAYMGLTRNQGICFLCNGTYAIRLVCDAIGLRG